MRSVVLVVDNVDTQENPRFMPLLMNHLKSISRWPVAISRSSPETVAVFDTYDVKAVILSGGPMLLTRATCPSKFMANMTAMHLAKCPVLGICFGMQSMVMLRGGVLHNMTEREDGCRTMVRIGPSELLQDVPRRACFASAFVDACDIVPPGFVVTAVEERTGVPAVIEHTLNYYYGIQFHPEDSGKHGRRVIQNFLSICDVVNKGFEA